MTKQITQVSFHKKAKVKRKGINAKTRNSVLKSSKNYRKVYRGQGK